MLTVDSGIKVEMERGFGSWLDPAALGTYLQHSGFLFKPSASYCNHQPVYLKAFSGSDTDLMPL